MDPVSAFFVGFILGAGVMRIVNGHYQHPPPPPASSSMTEVISAMSAMDAMAGKRMAEIRRYARKPKKKKDPGNIAKERSDKGNQKQAAERDILRLWQQVTSALGIPGHLFGGRTNAKKIEKIREFARGEGKVWEMMNNPLAGAMGKFVGMDVDVWRPAIEAGANELDKTFTAIDNAKDPSFDLSKVLEKVPPEQLEMLSQKLQAAGLIPRATPA